VGHDSEINAVAFLVAGTELAGMHAVTSGLRRVVQATLAGDYPVAGLTT